MKYSLNRVNKSIKTKNIIQFLIIAMIHIVVEELMEILYTPK